MHNIFGVEMSNEEKESTPLKQYEFRKLNSTDVFPMIKIISKIGLDELTQVFDGDAIKEMIAKAKSANVDKEESKEGQSEFIIGVGIVLKLANKILENLPLCENEIYTLLSRVSNKDVEEIKNLDIDVFFEMIVEFIKKEEFKGFIKVASKFIK